MMSRAQVLSGVSLALVIALALLFVGTKRGDAPVRPEDDSSPSETRVLVPSAIVPDTKLTREAVGVTIAEPQFTHPEEGDFPRAITHWTVSWQLALDGIPASSASLVADLIEQSDICVSLAQSERTKVFPVTNLFEVKGREIFHGGEPVEASVVSNGALLDSVRVEGQDGDDLLVTLRLDELRKHGKVIVETAPLPLPIKAFTLEDERGRRHRKLLSEPRNRGTIHVPAGNYRVRALLGDNRRAHGSVEVWGGGEAIAELTTEPSGAIELAIKTGANLIGASELVVRPRSLGDAQLMSEAWAAFGFPTYALSPGEDRRYVIPSAPAGIYDVVLQSLDSIQGHSLRHVGSVEVVGGETSLLELDLTQPEPLLAPLELRITESYEAQVVLRSDGDALLYFGAMHLRSPFLLPLGAYSVRARTMDAGRLLTPVDQIETLNFDLGMVGLDLDVPAR